MIPKIIHYCWFGSSQKPKIVEDYIYDWKTKLIDYQFIEWNENTFDINNSCQFVIDAYKNKKYAFVADFVRLYALKNYGGIYLDTDVEIIKPYDDFLHLNFFISRESRYSICTATIGAYKENPIINDLYKSYLNKEFNVNQKLTPNSEEFYNYFKNKYGYKYSKKPFSIDEFSIIYPNNYFSPINCYTGKKNIDDNTYSIHRFQASWHSSKQLKKEKFKMIITRIIGERTRYLIKRLYKKIIH